METMLRMTHNAISVSCCARAYPAFVPIDDQSHWYAGLDATRACEDVRDAESDAYNHHDGLYDEWNDHEPHCGLAAEVHREH